MIAVRNYFPSGCASPNGCDDPDCEKKRGNLAFEKRHRVGPHR